METNKNNEWCKYDFLVNKYYWIHRGIEKSLPIRKNNLTDLVQVLDKNNVPFWLQGKTLLGAYQYGKFLNDHDDDIGIDSQYRIAIETVIAKKLKAIGFKMIRNNEHMISFIRGERYIDVCLFVKKNKKYGYSKKWFPSKHFDSFDTIKFLELDILIPNNTSSLLKVMYGNNKLTKITSLSKKLFLSSNYLNFSRKVAAKVLNYTPHYIRFSIAWLFIPLGLHYKKITLKEFKSLMIEPTNSFNWKWRKPHLDIITNNQTARSVAAMIDYIGDKNNLNRLISKVNETDTSYVFYEPHNFDPRFWQSGNNYFIYNIKYQFRKNVLQYECANQYIKDNKTPLLYTAKYYESLDIMSEKDIDNLLRNNPVEISGNAVTSGKHRVSAMIGRIVAGKGYIHFWAIIKNY